MSSKAEHPRGKTTRIEIGIAVVIIGLIFGLVACVSLPEKKPAVIFGLSACLSSPEKKPTVTLGIEMLMKNPGLIENKRVGLITNPTGVSGFRSTPTGVRGFSSTIDLIASLPNVELVALFGPEHSIRGGVSGTVEGSYTDKKTSTTVYSLYGKTRRPTAEMLEGVDVLMFDIQDTGVRAYTYISTLHYCMEAAAEHDIKFVVLDRPNPLGGRLVEGPVLNPKFRSFIGVAEIAYVYGMTVGEIALYFNTECGINCDLKIIKMKGWKRHMTWEDTGLPWVPTSPHVPEAGTPWFCPITGIMGETPLVNIGVGYTLPFKLVGAPWMDAEEVAEALNGKGLPGVYFQPFVFKPYYLHYKGEVCEGVRIIITDKTRIRPVATGYHIMETLMKMYPDDFNFKLESVLPRLKMFDLANGTDETRKQLTNGVPVEKIIKGFQEGVEEFMKKREKYLLYP